MSNPVNEYLEVKEAGFFSGLAEGAKKVVKHPVFQFHAGALGVAVAGRTILNGMDSAILAITRKRDFNNMMDHSPDLQEARQGNPKQFNAHFNRLRRMNPTFSKDPVVAATYMRQMEASPATAGVAAVQALQSRRSLPLGALEATSQGRMPQMPFQSPGQQEIEGLQAEKLRMYPKEQKARADADQVKEQRDVERHEAWQKQNV